jgi:hypothetical protein
MVTAMTGLELDLYCQEHDQVSLEALASLLNMHPAVEEMMELGIVTPVRREGDLVIFDTKAIVRMRAGLRLRRTLGVNLAGISIILDMLDRICALERENQKLRIEHP